MRYEYWCNDCWKTTSEEHLVASKPDNWEPDESVICSHCGKRAFRTFGAAISVQENRDQLKHVGASLSNQRGVEFVGDGFPDVERKLDAEQQEITAIMDEPVTHHDVEAGYEQMEQLEIERDKPKGFYSGKREEMEVEEEHADGVKVKKMVQKKRGAEALKQDAEKAKAVRGI